MTRRSGRGGRRWTFWSILAVVPWVVVARAARAPIRDNSFLWHIRAGALQAELGSVLTEDPFSYTFSGRPWRTQSWLADLFYGWWHGVSTLQFVPWMVVGVGALVLVAAGLAVWSESRSAAAVGIGSLLSGLLLAPFLNPRPVVWSFLFLGVLVLVEQDRKLRWVLPPLFWVWASVHGSFPLGGLYLVVRTVQAREWGRARREAPAIAAAVLATAHGWGAIEILTAFGGSGSALAIMSEWAPPDIVSWGFGAFLFGLLALLAAGAWGRLKPADVWLVVPFVLVGLSSTRFLLPAWLVLLPVMSRGFDPGGRVELGRRSLPGGAVVVGLVLVLPFLLPGSGGLDEDRFAVDLLARAEPDKVLHDEVVGGYVAYALWPSRRVFIDDRAELYGDFLGDFVEARDGKPGWADFVKDSGADQAILDHRSALAQLLLSTGWRQLAAQGDYVLLEDSRWRSKTGEAPDAREGR